MEKELEVIIHFLRIAQIQLSKEQFANAMGHLLEASKRLNNECTLLESRLRVKGQ